MEQWKLITAMVVVFAFILEIRPMDSFLTAYLTSPKINVTLKEVSEDLSPFRIYAGVLGTLLVFLLSDYLRYKPVMVSNGLIGILTYVCLLDARSIFDLKVAEIGLSWFVCAEVSYFGYLYAKIKDKEHYQIATGYVKAATLSGRCLSGLLGQILVYTTNNNYYVLSYYSLASMAFAFTWSCFLPAVKYGDDLAVENAARNAAKKNAFSKETIYNTEIRKYSSEKVDSHNVERTTMATVPFKYILKDFKDMYMNPKVLRFCFWHIMGMAGYVQVFVYINVLYTYIANESNNSHTLLNGAVDSFATMSAALCSYKIGKLDVDWTKHGDSFLAVTSLAIGTVMYFCSVLKNNIPVYIMYILFSILVHSVFVIAISQIAKNIKGNCYTFVLGFNCFLGNVLSTFLSMVLVWIPITISNEFFIYSCGFFGLGAFYGYLCIFNWSTKSRQFERLP